MASKQHAILSASGADRWIHCPPSARLCETYEDKGSGYAAEGTDAHAMTAERTAALPFTEPTAQAAGQADLSNYKIFRRIILKISQMPAHLSNPVTLTQ